MKEYEVVISGISGSFPECTSVQELENSAFNNECFVNDINPRWQTQEVPRMIGKIKNIVKFDDTFFGIHRKLTIVLDPHAKHAFEKTYEAICDAGRNPTDFYDTKTAVVMASSINETEGENMLESKHIGHLLLGYSRSMQSNRVSYAFNFSGPSMTLIGSWESGMAALEMARSLVAKGHVRQAIVGATNMIFYPQISRHFQHLGKLNKDGKTKSFSANADGYSRSDGVVVFFLQRAEDALRSYATVVKSYARTDMTNRCGLVQPMGFKDFLSEFYENTPIKPSQVAYVQADGSAALATDGMELEAMAEVMCPGREGPLPVTSCKPKLGHCESASALVSIVNALIAMKTGYIPPMLHYSKPNPHAPSLADGTIKLVTEKTALNGDYVGVTSIGLISGFGHALLKRNPRKRPPVKPGYFPEDGIPRLFLLSGRDESHMKSLLTKVGNASVDDGFYSLNHHLYRKDIPKHLFRGYSLKLKDRNQSQIIPYSGGEKRPVWYIFSGMGSQWPEMGRVLMQIPPVRRSIESSHRILKTKGIDLISIVTSSDAAIFDNILNCFVGIAAIQIALVDLLDELGVKADGMVGHSVGELGCSYADRCLTAEQIILAAYARGKASNEASLIKGMMAAVGKGYNDLKDRLPEGIEIACHNSETSCTLSGPADLMTEYVSQLKARGVFARLVNVANIAYHSRNIAPAAPYLLKYLKEIIPEPKARSSKWISSSIPESRWNTELARTCSAEYHTNNLLSYVLFEEATSHIPDNAICIEVAPHGLLQAIVKKSLPNCSHVPLTNRAKPGCAFIIEALALMFNNGIDLDLTRLYPKVEYPLPRETEYLHPFITWNHTEDWIPISLERDLENKRRNISNKEVDLFSRSEELFEMSLCHVVGGSTVYPSANLLKFMMDYVDEKMRKTLSFKCYDFQNLKFHEHLILDNKRFEKVGVLYQSASGTFETAVGDTVLLSGRVEPLTALPGTLVGPELVASPAYRHRTEVDQQAVYQYFADNRCAFSDRFRNITDIKITETGFVGRVKWCGSAENYLDGLLKLMVFYESVRADRLLEVESVHQLIYDPTSVPQEHTDVHVYYDGRVGHMSAAGVRVAGVTTRPVRLALLNPEMERLEFTPYADIQTKNDFLDHCLQVVSELAGTECVRVIGNDSSQIFQDALQSKYFKLHLSSKANVKQVGLEGKELVEEWSDPSGAYLFVAETSLPESVLRLIDSSNNTCFVVLAVNQSQLNAVPKFKRLSLSLEKVCGDQRLIFLKKHISPISEANFIQVPEGCLLAAPESSDELAANKKINFLFFKYKTLSDVSFILRSSKSFMETKNVRLVLMDNTGPAFNPMSEVYSRQLGRDVKVSVWQNGRWGWLSERRLQVPRLDRAELRERRTPLNRISCDNIDLKLLGFSLQNLVNPSINNKLGAVDYTGSAGGRDVMGVARLTPDNRLEPDPVLLWNKPSSWTLGQAATVPYFYSLAYYLLRIQRLPEVNPLSRVFLHGAHTPFSQAVISVALGMKATLYTTCYTPRQKQDIIKRFPKMDSSKIYVLDNGGKYIADRVLESTQGEGVDLILDCLEDDELRKCTMQCLGKNGKYFFFCHDDTKSDFVFGMSIFMKETVVMGFNPDMMLDMIKEKKEALVKFVEDGIARGHVVPLDAHLIPSDCSRKQVVEAVVNWSGRDGESKKVLINTSRVHHKPLQESNGVNGTVEAESNNYMIIGTYNSLWYDMVSWLASKGADNIFVVMEWNHVPSHIQIRFKSLVKRHTDLNVRFLESTHLESSEKFEQSLQLYGETLDKVFYIMPGVEKNLDMVEGCLRKQSKDSWLVCIGNELSNPCVERRLSQGLKAVSFVLKRENLSNKTVINVLDHWLERSDHSNQIIFLDEQDRDTRRGVDDEPDILMRREDELVDLVDELESTCCFLELPTSSPPMAYINELDPVFFFPGFKVSKMKSLISRFTCPSLMAKYPPGIKSYEQVVSPLAQEMLKFKLYMFNLVAEGWAGPLALKVAKLLEEDGRACQIILLDGAPSAVRKWSKASKSRHNLISKSLFNVNVSDTISIEDLKSSKDVMAESLMRSDKFRRLEGEVRRGLDTVIERLEALEDMTQIQVLARSKIHVFSSRKDPLENTKDITLLNEICRLGCEHHVVEEATSDSLLDCRSLLRDVRNLALVEYKGAAVRQDVNTISTLRTKELK